MTQVSMFQLVLFLIFSALLAYISRGSLRAPASHGFWRFLAWECLLALFLWNAWAWFRRPFSTSQVISWVLLSISAFLAIYSARQLARQGRPDPRRAEPSLLGIERTTSLITKGAYRYIRHPLYSSLLYLGWGIFFKQPTLVSGGLAVAATGFLFATAKTEEAENRRYFGPSYQEYMRRTKMFIPYVW